MQAAIVYQQLMSAFDVCKRNTEPVAETILRSVNTHFKVLFGTDKLLKIINAPLFRGWGELEILICLKCDPSGQCHVKSLQTYACAFLPSQSVISSCGL